VTLTFDLSVWKWWLWAPGDYFHQIWCFYKLPFWIYGPNLTDGRTDGHLHTMQPAPYDRRTEILQYVAIEHKWVIHRKYTVKIHTTW